MGQCGGALVVHLDSTMAACTEEFEGRCCAGPDAVHLGGRRSCQEVLGPGACEMCALEALSPRPWRHSVHLALRYRSARVCTAHRHVRPPAYRAVDVDAPQDLLHAR